MGAYKLRHFALFLFQSLNDALPGMKEAITAERTIFMRDINLIEHAEGVKLIMRAADRNYYITLNSYS